MYSFQSMKSLLGFENAKTDEQYQKEFSHHFFYANVCQYCSKFDKDEAVKRCSSCQGMFYCSREHQKSHYLTDHKEFCEKLTSVRLALDNEYLFEDLPDGKKMATKKHLEKNKEFIETLNSVERTAPEKEQLFRNLPGKLMAKSYLMDVVEMHMKRPLNPYEINMIMFPRVCIVCHEGNPRLVKSCTDCPHGNFCTEHLEDEYHKKLCKYFNYCFYLDQLGIVFKDLPLEDFINDFPRNSKYIELPATMVEFLDTYVVPHNTKFDFGAAEVRMLVSTIFTRPLTLIYVLQKFKLTDCSQLLIHVISKKRFEEKHFNEWEILFHWFPKLKFLRIAFIGTHILPRKLIPTLCKTCTAIKRNLKIEISELLYTDYYKKTPRTPDIIIAYNVDFMSCCTWADASSLLTSLNTPIVLTSMSEHDILAGVQDCVSNPKNFSQIELNPFASLKAERSYHNITYSNNLITIYGDVFPKICDAIVDSDVDELATVEIQKELHSEIEQKNALLKTKIELLKIAQQQFKTENEKTQVLLEELRTISNLYYDLEDRIYKHLGFEFEDEEGEEVLMNRNEELLGNHRLDGSII